MQKKFNKNKGYTKELAGQYVDIDKEFMVVSEIQKVNVYDEDDKSYTDEFSHNYIYFAQEETFQPIKVKIFEEELNIKFGQKVNLIELEACSVDKSVYFKAKSLEVV